MALGSAMVYRQCGKCARLALIAERKELRADVISIFTGLWLDSELLGAHVTRIAGHLSLPLPEWQPENCKFRHLYYPDIYQLEGVTIKRIYCSVVSDLKADRNSTPLG